MNKFVYVLPLLALAACSKPSQPDNEAPRRSAADESDVSAPAGIAVTAAPGVAFSYHYAFSLPRRASPARRKRMRKHARSSASRAAGSPACDTAARRKSDRGVAGVQARSRPSPAPSASTASPRSKPPTARSSNAEITGTDAGAAIGRRRATAPDAQGARSLRIDQRTRPPRSRQGCSRHAGTAACRHRAGRRRAPRHRAQIARAIASPPRRWCSTTSRAA